MGMTGQEGLPKTEMVLKTPTTTMIVKIGLCRQWKRQIKELAVNV